MFRRLGQLAARYRIAIIIGWIAAAVLLIVTAPPLDSVSSTDQRDFMPADAPFARAQEVYEQAFPDQFGLSSTVILIDAGEGGDVHDPAVWAYMQQVEAWLAGDDAPENLADVTAPTSNPDFADALISPDNRIALISAAITTPTAAAQTTQAVGAIDDWLAENSAPAGATVYQTGEAGLNAQAEESTFTTMDRTVILTFGLVIIALLLIYRSPVSPLIPLFSVTVAFIATVGLLGHLANAHIVTIIAQVNALLVVVMYGAGTDYCLFLISRFREEMAEHTGVQEATRRTVGPGLTVIVLVFLAYNLWGDRLPGVLGHGPIDYRHFLDILVFTTDGIYGVPVRVALTYVFLFGMFGTFLSRAGGGDFFFDAAAALTGRRPGGPAKIAVVSSGLYGTISGSPTADVVATGSI
ncbi:MAG: MMPL family transporter, partial [Anaerolineae bacterium]|nr:MMPL family transporter [Anaerolineae bacterium]